MATTVATELNNICQEKKLEIEYTYKRSLNEFKMDVWTATVEIGKRVWVGNGSSSRKKARNSAAGEAYPDLKRERCEDEKRGGDNGEEDEKRGGDNSEEDEELYQSKPLEVVQAHVSRE